jgi:hypothetical protein
MQVRTFYLVDTPPNTLKKALSHTHLLMFMMMCDVKCEMLVLVLVLTINSTQHKNGEIKVVFILSTMNVSVLRRLNTCVIQSKRYF